MPCAKEKKPGKSLLCNINTGKHLFNENWFYTGTCYKPCTGKRNKVVLEKK